MRFAHRPLGGVVIALIGAGIGWVVVVKAVDATAHWIGGIAGGFFALIGMGAAFWRYELTFDLLSRTYSRRKGFWPNPKQDQGSFQDIESVTLNVDYRSSSSKSSSVRANWQIGLKLRTDANPIRMAEEISEEKAYRRFESLAKKLRIPAVDRTGAQEKVLAWDELDSSFASRKQALQEGFASSREIPSLPAGSRVEFSSEPGARTIRLPGLGFNSGSVFFFLFGMVFFSFAAFFGWAKWTRAVPVHESSPTVGWVVVAVFSFIGLGIAGLGIFAGAARDCVREEPGALIFAQQVFGRECLVHRLEKREVEDVSIKEATYQSGRPSITIGKTTLRRSSGGKARMEVVVRSDKYVARLGGDLSDVEREWLLAALTAMAGE